MNDEVRYELNVADEQGNPVDGATVWFFGDLAIHRDLLVDDMARLVRRYAKDADFIFAKSLHPLLLIERTQASGEATVLREEVEMEGLRSIRTHMAVIKRGFFPEVISREAKRGEAVKISVRLRRDSSWKSDPRLQQLDHLRAIAAAESAADDLMTEGTQKQLTNLDSQLRALAASFEKEGLTDEAGTVYYNLAYLPGVTIDVDPSSGIVTRGYTNGFDATSRQRVADRERAWKLVRGRPALEYQQTLERYRAKGLFGPPSPARDGVRKEFIAEMERMFGAHPEQMWPTFYTLPWRMYGSLREADRACDAIKAFFSFEPSYYDAAGWKGLIEDYEADVKQFGSSPTRKCELPAMSR